MTEELSSEHRELFDKMVETHFTLVDEAAHVALFDEARTIKLLVWLHERGVQMVREIHAERPTLSDGSTGS